MSASNAVVEGHAFEEGLRRLEAECTDPQAGLFGPTSTMWFVLKEAGVFLGAGAALLLQIAHPFVAQGITDHSRALRDPIGRFHRTFSPIFSMIYGTRDEALAAARKVRRVHNAITGTLPGGTPYLANDANALLWVHMTLWHTAIAVYERVVAPLTEPQKDQFQREANRFALLFGIPEALHDTSWAAFTRRFDAMVASGMLTVTPEARAIADYFVGAGPDAFGRWLPRWYRALTGDLLPSTLADGFGLPRDPDAVHRAVARVARAYKYVPGALRHVSPYEEARARLAGHAPSPIITTLNRVWLGRPRLSPAH